MSELAAQRNDERTKRETAERRVAELEASAKNPPASAVAKAVADPTDADEPKPDAYPDAVAWASDVVKHRVKKEVAAMMAERDAAAHATAAQQRAEAVKSTFVQRMDAAIAAIPDFKETVLEAPDTVLYHDDVRDFAMESELGPEILYVLAKDDAERDRINKMTDPRARNRAIGKIEARIEAAQAADGQETDPEPAKPARTAAEIIKRTTKAPAPINPLKSPKTGADLPVGADGEWKGSYQQFKAARESGKLH